MKGIKGERKCYGILSPFDHILTRAGLSYQGTRMTNGYQKAPWYMYGTDAGDEAPDLEELFKNMLATGWKIRNDLDGNQKSFPSTGEARGGKEWESYELETERNGVLHTIHFVKFHYPKKPAKDYVSVNEITYPPY